MHWFKRWKEEGRTRDDADHVRINMKRSKKAFSKKIRQLSKKYDEQEITEAAKYAEVNRDSFWRLFKRTNKPGKSAMHAIKTRDDVVVYEVDEVLEVCRGHFDALSTPKVSERFDDENFEFVKNRVSELTTRDDISPFLDTRLSEKEVHDAIQKLNIGKAPGHDKITSEHVKLAGYKLVEVLCFIFNLCITIEYVPINFRRGIQVPLYKGKNTCSLNPDNYRGITLLSTFNKLFEVIIWGRINRWWFDEQAVSELQGAGRKGSSCIHTALTLQETIAKEREVNKNVFVAYYDVAKAFDSVWIDGLFYQLNEMGIRGSLWRILYKTYQNFRCRVRIGDNMSDWYDMECGIHQGGYLSLVKYTAFINSLISSLETSGVCSSIYRIQTSPVGYADDIAASTKSKRRMDLVMDRVFSHSCLWRYTFNADKSAVLVFGESKRDRRIGSANRVFSLGPERVKERLYYDHVGVKTCVQGDTHVRTEEKVAKARKVLNMASTLGIKKGGLSLSACNLIFWMVVMPTLCFGCEIWVIKKKDVKILKAFQRYSARRLQRFHSRSINATCFTCLGWMDIVTLIKVRKIIFLRTIMVMSDFSPLRKILIERIREDEEIESNMYDSPLKQILQLSREFDLFDSIEAMIDGGIPSKSEWKKRVWGQAWEAERNDWQIALENCRYLRLLGEIITQPTYVVWWSIADYDRRFMRRCEVMVRLLCHASLLKDDDCKLKGTSIWTRMCSLCDLGCIEDAQHIVMQCPFQTRLRTDMFHEIVAVYPEIGQMYTYAMLIGKPIDGIHVNQMYIIWTISCTFISKMYWSVLRESRDNTP